MWKLAGCWALYCFRNTRIYSTGCSDPEDSGPGGQREELEETPEQPRGRGSRTDAGAQTPQGSQPVTDRGARQGEGKGPLQGKPVRG